MNKTCLVGRLTAKPELRYTQSNKSVVRFTVAVNRQGEGADFINCTAWGKTAENIANYLDKGSMISVEGRIQTGSYTNNQGQKIYTTDIVAESVQFLSNKRSNQAEQEQVIDQDPFSEFGEQVSIDDNFLD